MKTFVDAKVGIMLFLLITINSFGQCWKPVVGHGEANYSGYGSSVGIWVNIKLDGTLWKWTNSGPELHSSDNWLSVSNGGGYIYGIKSNGTLWKIYADYTSPFNGSQVGSDTNWVSVTGNKSSFFAIKNDGSLWSWGTNEFGELGYGTVSAWNIITENPLQIGNAIDWKTVSVGMNFVSALKLDGTLWSWGKRTFGVNGNVITPVPTQVGTETNWSKIDLGSENTLALKTDGTLWKVNYLNAATQIGLDNDWKEISNYERYYSQGYYGGYHIWTYRMIKNDGTLWVLGKDGPGDYSFAAPIYYIPTQTEPTGDYIFISSEHLVFAVKSDNSLWYGYGVSPTLAQVSCSNLSTAEVNIDDKLTLSPNPVNNELRINVGNNIIEQIVVSDLSGKRLMEWNSNLSIIQLTDLSSGVYIIQVKTEDKILQAKFIKE